MDIGWFCESCYRDVASEGDFNVTVFWRYTREVSHEDRCGISTYRLLIMY